MTTSRLYNKLAIRIAAFVTAAGFLASWLALAFVPAPQVVIAIFLALLAGAAAYGTAYALVARRLELARDTLREVRTRRFEALSSFPQTRARDELDELVNQAYRAGRALQEEIERLKQLENYRSEYLGDVSHELRTPIFAISGFAETLLDGAMDDDTVCRRFIEKIENNAQRLDALTKDLAEISRIETGELKMTAEPFDLKAILRQTTESLEIIARDRNIELTVQMPPRLPNVVGDRERIRQVLINLIENAIKYNEPGGQVEVLVRRISSRAVRIAVVDDGIGIPPDHIARLTERFFRVDKSRSREQGGTGLGLAIVKHILEAHGQHLEIDSRSGYGSQFTFELPLPENPDSQATPLQDDRATIASPADSLRMENKW